MAKPAPVFAPRDATRVLAVLALLPLLLAGCSRGQSQDHGGPAGSGGPAPVTAVTVQPEAVPVTLEYPAQTIGSREVEVRARVTGIIEKRNYEEGGRVKRGQSMFTIDPAPFAAALARAEADVAAAKARHAQAQREAARLKPLIEGKAISQKEYDDAVSAEAIAAADVQAARARLTEARLNMGYTRVESPIAGIAGRALKSEGSLVSGPDVLLTTVTQVDPIQVLFGISDNQRLELQQEVQAGRVQWPKDNRFKVVLTFADGSEYPKKGVLDFTSVRVSPETGTSEARADVPNADNWLRPGQFVRVRLEGAARPAALLVPQRAVLEGPQGKFVYVIGKDSKAEARPVQVKGWSGDRWVVSEGLKAGDQVIVDGVLKIGPGAPVQAAAPARPGAPAPQAAAKPAPGR